MLARSLLRVPNRAIARQFLGKSTVRHPTPRISPLSPAEEGNRFAIDRSCQEKGFR